MIEYLKSKKNVLIILVIALVIVIVGIVIAVSLNRPKPTVETPKKDEADIKNTSEIIEDGKIEVTDFRINFNKTDQRWYLSMNVKNSSDEEIDLRSYFIKLYSKEEVVVILGGKALGKIPAKAETGSIIVLTEDYSHVDYIEIAKE